MNHEPTDDAPGLDVLEHATARGDLAARWYLRARSRGETVSEEHVRTVADLEAGRAPSLAPLVFEHLNGG